LGLSRHCRVTHQIDKDKLRVIVYNNGKDPLCKCGCGEQVSWNYTQEKFNDFKHGHYVRTTGGFYSPDGAKKSGETRKQKFHSGELTQWNKGISFEDSYGKDRASQMKLDISENKERSVKISNGLRGKKKSMEHVRKITEDRRKYWANDENRIAQRDRRLVQFAENRVGKVVNNKLEQTFRGILDAHDIEYIQSFNSGRFVYDFYIPSENILIEVDGDFYHSNPLKYPNGPVYDIQIHNAKNDKIKNEWAKANGYTLLRFWESDIQDNRLQVVKTLIENLL
jgi:very-short-patch-repair endonuclease